MKKYGKKESKYLRLTGLWPSKSNRALFTGRLKEDGVADLMEKLNEAQENGAPIVFSLWKNDEKESRKDPDFSLQCFVGDSEEQPRFKKRKPAREEEEEADEDEEEEEAPRKKKKVVEEEEEEAEEEEEEDEAPKKKVAKKSTRKSDW
jgi:alpha-galactosidase/6-phospho-beta-glucosidase family protein